MAAGAKSASASKAITTGSRILLFIEYLLSLVYPGPRSLHLLTLTMLFGMHYAPVNEALEFSHRKRLGLLVEG
jgi:hypothetical protein